MLTWEDLRQERVVECALARSPSFLSRSLVRIRFSSSLCFRKHAHAGEGGSIEEGCSSEEDLTTPLNRRRGLFSEEVSLVDELLLPAVFRNPPTLTRDGNRILSRLYTSTACYYPTMTKGEHPCECSTRSSHVFRHAWFAQAAAGGGGGGRRSFSVFFDLSLTLFAPSAFNCLPGPLCDKVFTRAQHVTVSLAVCCSLSVVNGSRPPLTITFSCSTVSALPHINFSLCADTSSSLLPHSVTYELTRERSHIVSR